MALRRKTAVSASDFARNFGRYRVEAQRAPIPISNHGEITGYFISKPDYDAMIARLSAQPLPAQNQRSHMLEELSPDILDAIANSRMDSKHDHLNELLDD